MTNTIIPNSGTKRKHSSDPEEPEAPADVLVKRPKSEPETIKHPDYWYDDGNVVIQIDNTQFKLYRGQLSRHSAYFADLFKEPAEETQRHVEGYPHYVVDGTNVEDFQALLGVVDSTVEFVTVDAWPKHNVIASILRASTALSFPKIRELCIYVLQDTWPCELDSYDSYKIPFAAETVILAKECHVPNVLKRSYYELVRCDGLHQSDGDQPDPCATLSLKELYLLSATKSKLAAEWMSLIAVPSPFECVRKINNPAKTACLSATIRKAEWYKIVHESNLVEDYSYDPIGGLEALIDADWKAGKFCIVCIKTKRAEWVEKQKKLWEKLDEWLNFKDIEAQFVQP